MPTKIPWTDETWPVVTGCYPCSTGCKNCYAARMAATRLRYHPRYKGLAVMYESRPMWTGEIRLNHDVLEQPLHWRKPRMIFIASMSDLFHKDVPDNFIFDILEIVAQCPRHIFQVLTKRPKRMAHLWRNASEDAYPNLWLGTSVENQATADERIPILKQILAAVRFVSFEPLLSNIIVGSDIKGSTRDRWLGISWAIVGGESGPGARPMHPDWARSLRGQCQAAGTPFFLKQWGEYLGIDYTGEKIAGVPMWTRADGLSGRIGRQPEIDFGDGHGAVRIGKKRAGRLLDGQLWDEFPVSMP